MQFIREKLTSSTEHLCGPSPYWSCENWDVIAGGGAVISLVAGGVSDLARLVRLVRRRTSDSTKANRGGLGRIMSGWVELWQGPQPKGRDQMHVTTWTKPVRDVDAELPVFPVEPAAPEKPPDNNMGVEFSADWLTFTCDLSALTLSEMLGRHLSGTFETKGSGGNGYRNVMRDDATGATIWFEPAGYSDRWPDGRCTVMLPGTACSYLGCAGLRAVVEEVSVWSRGFQVTRLDLAFDHRFFAARDLWDHITGGGRLRTLAKRNTIRHWEDVARVGTVYVGSRTSGRMLRVYDKEDFCRVELECKAERAHLILRDLMDRPTDAWGVRAWAHMLDFISVDAPWWVSLCRAVGSAVVRAGLTLAQRAEKTYNQVKAWLRRQVAPAFGMVGVVEGLSGLLELAEEGGLRLKRSPVFDSSPWCASPAGAGGGA